jgi:hypothetical protein
MASVWGPMGWITLHSIAAAYPDEPTQEMRSITSSFLEKFAETITCPHCKTHFSRMLAVYQSSHPDFLNNRRNFFLFTVRAHNTVNKRLDKPILQTVSECLETLRNATKNVSPSQFRINYFSYVARNWIHELGGDGRINFNITNDMKKLNTTFFSQTNDEFDKEIEEGDVLELIEDTRNIRFSTVLSRYVATSPDVGFKGGRLKLKRT